MEQSAEAEHASSLRYGLCSIGLALLLAVSWCGDLIPTSQAAAALSVPFFLSSAINVAAFLLCALRPQGLRRLAGRREALIGIAVLLMGARVLETLVGPYLLSSSLLIVGVAIYNLLQPVLLLLWISACCLEAPRATQIILPLAFLLTSFIYFLLMALNPILVTALLCLLPAISALLYLWRTRCAPMSPSPGEATMEEHTAWSFPVYPVVLIVIYKFVFYFSLSLTAGPSMYGPLGILFISLLALIATILFFDRYRPTLLYKLALPLLVFGLLLLAWLDTGSVVATFSSNASNIGLELFIFMALASICYRYDIDAIWMFGIVETFASLATALGWFVGVRFTAAYPVGTFGANVVVTVIIVALILLSALFFDERTVERTFGTVPIGKAEDTAEGGTLTVVSHYEDLMLRCETVSRRFGLTHREEEILELLAQGMSAARIEEELCISNSTAKTHVHHIYEKLGIHSRDEARRIVEEIR